MSKSFKLVWWAFCLSLCLCIACNPEEDVNQTNSIHRQSFMTQTQEGLYLQGSTVLVYGEEMFQRAIAPRRRMYRLQDDLQQRFAQFTFLDYPKKEGSLVQVACFYKVGKLDETPQVEMQCVKIQGNKYWFWNQKHRMGVIVPAQVFE